MTDPSAYIDGLLCEHRYPDGQFCGAAAAVVLEGDALCATHFDARIEARGEALRDSATAVTSDA